jgi:nitrite reductase (NO-forming)/hydroxylamine reductase
MKKSHKVLVPVKDRPTKPEVGAENWKDYFSVILRDVGQIAIIDGKTKEIKSVVPSGFATHITRTSASGRYIYVIGRDGKASMIDIWMKEPKNVAEIQVCNDARAIDTSKHKDYLDKYAVVGCYWPPSIVTLEADTLDPLKIVSTGSYTYDTNEYAREARVAAIIASHDKPEWVINIKETGQVWLYDYSNIKNPKITMVEQEVLLAGSIAVLDFNGFARVGGGKGDHSAFQFVLLRGRAGVGSKGFVGVSVGHENLAGKGLKAARQGERQVVRGRRNRGNIGLRDGAHGFTV